MHVGSNTFKEMEWPRHLLLLPMQDLPVWFSFGDQGLWPGVGICNDHSTSSLEQRHGARYMHGGPARLTTQHHW